MGLNQGGEEEEEFKGANPGSPEGWMHFDSEKEGLLNVPGDPGSDARETQWMREHHNASHALWYFSMVVYAIIHEKPHQNTQQKTERILAHLTHLREFISDKDSKGQKLVSRLFDALLNEKPDNHAKWTRFIYAHWNLIWNFAERYGHHEKCFPEKDYRKICDIVHQRYLFKAWWWQMIWGNLKKKIQLNH